MKRSQIAVLKVVPCHGVQADDSSFRFQPLGLVMARPPQTLSNMPTAAALRLVCGVLAEGLATVEWMSPGFLHWRKYFGALACVGMFSAFQSWSLAQDIAVLIRPVMRATRALSVVGVLLLLTGDVPMFQITGRLILSYAVSLYIHEMGHLFAYRAIGRKHGAVIIVQRGANVYIRREKLPWLEDCAVSVAGPLCVSLVALIANFFVPLDTTFALGLWAIAIGHLGLLFLPSQDNTAIREAWRSRERD